VEKRNKFEKYGVYKVYKLLFMRKTISCLKDKYTKYCIQIYKLKEMWKKRNKFEKYGVYKVYKLLFRIYEKNNKLFKR